MLVLATLFVAAQTYNPFIYYRFSMKNNRVFKWVLFVFFMGVCWLPMVTSFFPALNPSAAGWEQRDPAPKPDLSLPWHSPATYFPQFQLFYRDNFGMRSFFVLAHHRIELALHTSPADIVIMGRNDFLYYGLIQQIETHTGKTRATPEDLESWRVYLQQIYEFCLFHKTSVVFSIATDKESVYPEYYPLPVTTEPLPYRQLLDYLKLYSDIPTVYVTDELIAEKSNHLLYNKHEGHWNAWGSEIFVKEIINAFHKQSRDRPTFQ